MRKQATTIDLKPWPFTQRPRVLIEHADPDEGLEIASELRRRGCTVGICLGPNASGDRPTRCPLHKLDPCVVVEGADAVVTVLGLEREEARGVVRGLRTRYPSTPIVVAATVAETLELADDLEGCTVVPKDAAPEHVVRAVLAELD